MKCSKKIEFKKILSLVLLIFFGYIGRTQLSVGPNERKMTPKMLVKEQPSNKFKQSLAVSFGISNESKRVNDIMENYCDTSEHRVKSHGHGSYFSIDHSFYLGNRLNMSYSVGLGCNRTLLDEEKLCSITAGFFVKPELDIVKKRIFNWYISLNIGVIYNDMNLLKIPDERIKRQLPQNFKLYTGFTPFGLTFKLSERLELDTRLSFWSYESLAIGIKYNFVANLFHQDFSTN